MRNREVKEFLSILVKKSIAILHSLDISRLTLSLERLKQKVESAIVLSTSLLF